MCKGKWKGYGKCGKGWQHEDCDLKTCSSEISNVQVHEPAEIAEQVLEVKSFGEIASKGKCKGKGLPHQDAGSVRPCAREGCKYQATWHPQGFCCGGCAKG